MIETNGGNPTGAYYPENGGNSIQFGNAKAFLKARKDNPARVFQIMADGWNNQKLKWKSKEIIDAFKSAKSANKYPTNSRFMKNSRSYFMYLSASYFDNFWE